MSGFLAPIPQSARIALFCFGTVLVWLRWRGPLSHKWPLPENRRLIPSEVFNYGMVRGAFQFGAELGTGVRTFVPSPAPYLLLLALVLGQLTLMHAWLIGLGFGLARAAPLIVHLSAHSREDVTRSFLQGHDDFAPNTAGVLVLIGVAILV